MTDLRALLGDRYDAVLDCADEALQGVCGRPDSCWKHGHWDDAEAVLTAVLPDLLAAADERDALAARVERVRALADLIDRHTEFERDPVDFRDASHGGSWDDVADRIRRALDEDAQP